MTFQELNLDEALLKAITDLGYEQPTEIQEKAIPLLVKGHQDFVGQAQTGTGKTAAFVLPLLSRLNPKARGAQA
ncbi:MAG: DEAD/DEAH box helicase, partial [Bacteriovoracaceae bacterium]|nr:DEAD/DEAH box helicase [Bacteriovoracaceae bacterium]